jgi:hypothetical protein
MNFLFVNSCVYRTPRGQCCWPVSNQGNFYFCLWQLKIRPLLLANKQEIFSKNIFDCFVLILLYNFVTMKHTLHSFFNLKFLTEGGSCRC